MTDEQKKVLEASGITDATDVSRYGSGHINETYKVETASGVRYILQRVNTTIFDVDLLKTNVVRVTEFLKSKGVKSLEVVGYDNPWRIYKFLEGYTSRDVVSEPHQAYDVGRAFAKFQNDLADIPPPRLEDIIPKFHDTPNRLKQLDDAAAKDVKGRLASVAAEMAFVDSWRKNASRIVDLMATGEIPERVTHNDTKINNVMIDAKGEAVVIDLDTTMPGSALFEQRDDRREGRGGRDRPRYDHARLRALRLRRHGQDFDRGRRRRRGGSLEGVREARVLRGAREGISRGREVPQRSRARESRVLRKACDV